MKNCYLLDTSILVNDPLAFKKMVGEVIIPITVVEELDKLKKQMGEVGKNSRVAIRQLDALTTPHLGCKVGKAFVKIDVGVYKDAGSSLYGDDRILACLKAHSVKKKNIMLLSADFNLRIRAKAMGLAAEDFTSETDVSDLYSGVRVVKNEDYIQEILEKGTCDLKGKNDFKPNECLILQDNEGHDVTLARKMANNTIKIVKRCEAWGIHPRNSEQNFAMDLISDPTVPLVTLMGKSGSGKTLVALACALELILTKKRYNKLVIYRPVQAVGGEEIGFIPGTKYEKLLVWMGAVMDNFEQLFSSGGAGKGRNRNWQDDLEMFIDKGLIEFDSIGYLRGRSISNQIILIDEGQNLSAEVAKTILTRVGTGSKIIWTGDVEQIDNNKLDAESNSLSIITDKFKDSKLSAHLTFKECIRSELADEAVKLFG
jgi:PhoH-like ATPase